MPKRQRSAKIPTPSWEQPAGRFGRVRKGLGARLYLVGGIIGLVIVAAVVVALAFVPGCLDERGRPGSEALAVGDTTYTLDHFADRWLLLTGGEGQPGVGAQQTIARLVREEVARQFASELGVSVTSEEVDERINGVLGLQSGESDPDADTLAKLYEDELAITGLTEEEFRQMSASQVYIEKIRDVLAEELPDVADQAKVRAITVESEEQGQNVIEQISDGGDFVTIAAQVDPFAVLEPDQLEWEARGSLEPALDDAIFALEVGQVGGPIFTSVGVLVFEIVDKAELDVTDEQQLAIGRRAFEEWAAEKREDLGVTSYVLEDVDKFEWAFNRVYNR